MGINLYYKSEKSFVFCFCEPSNFINILKFLESFLESFYIEIIISVLLIYLRVDIHVLLQTDCMAKGFSADAAAKRSHSTVRPPDVNLQSVRCGEYLQHN